MERVQTLSNKLQEQILQNVPIGQLLITVQMLQSELVHLNAAQPQKNDINGVSIHIAPVFESTAAEKTVNKPEERIVEVLKIDEAEVEAELDEIKRNAEIRNNISVQNKPQLLFDPVEDIPTLTHQQPTAEQIQKKEVHEAIAVDKQGSINERLKQAQIELTDRLQEVSIRDLRRGIGVNDRFLFIKELFRGDEVMYERSVKTINGFSIFPEAEYWIKRELKLKLGWNDSNEIVKQFDQLVRRRFS